MSETRKRKSFEVNRHRTIAIALSGGLLISSLTGCSEEPKTFSAGATGLKKKVAPLYECTELQTDTNSGQFNSVKVTVKVPQSGSAQFKGIAIDFHDGRGVIKSDAFPGTNESYPVTHEFPTAGTYPINAMAIFVIDGIEKRVSSANCNKEVAVTNIFED